MTKSVYLEMVEQMGIKPKPEEIPPDIEDFTLDTILVFEINSNLRDMWDGMSGSYLGKDLSTLPMLFNIYDIKNKETQLLYLRLLNIVIKENMRIISEKIKRDQAAANRKGAK